MKGMTIEHEMKIKNLLQENILSLAQLNIPITLLFQLIEVMASKILIDNNITDLRPIAMYHWETGIPMVMLSPKLPRDDNPYILPEMESDVELGLYCHRQTQGLYVAIRYIFDATEDKWKILYQDSYGRMFSRTLENFTEEISPGVLRFEKIDLDEMLVMATKSEIQVEQKENSDEHA